jgi:hypothetical protein
LIVEESGAVNNPGINAADYAHDSQLNTTTGMSPDFMFCRVGTVERFNYTPAVGSSAQQLSMMGNSGNLLKGLYRYKRQLIDRWGNLSPLSPSSNDVVLSVQRSQWYDTTATAWKPALVDHALKQLLLTGMSPGPRCTIGQLIFRSRDLINSGDINYYQLPPNYGGGATAYATICDNFTEAYPDNCADASLMKQPIDAVALGAISMVKFAFGRTWAVPKDRPNCVHPSLPGRYATFQHGDELYLDTNNEAITAMFRCAEGLLVFTRSSTFLVYQAEGGVGQFQWTTLSTTVGCEARDSIQQLKDGTIIGLTTKGFFATDGKTPPQIVTEQQFLLIDRINPGRVVQSVSVYDESRNIYYCWLPIDGSSVNNIAYCYSDAGWFKQQIFQQAAAAVVAQNVLKTILVAGAAYDSVGNLRRTIFALNQQAYNFTPAIRTYAIETTWLRSTNFLEKKTQQTVYLWLEEDVKGSMTMRVYRDYRRVQIEENTAITTYPTDDIAGFWDVETFDATYTAGKRPNVWRRRRVFVKRVDIGVHSTEAFKIRLESTVPFTLHGITFDYNVKPSMQRTDKN